jgi:hypothetical protein
MSDGAWRTLEEIRSRVGGSEAAISARLRDLRKDKFGGHIVESRRRGDGSRGLWEYRLVLDDVSKVYVTQKIIDECPR